MLNVREMMACPNCGVSMRAMVFPALFAQKGEIDREDHILAENEAGCFYHPGKKAIVPCAECGRFLCALCDVELGGKHVCPTCIDSGKKKGKLKTLENHRTLYDDIALSLSIMPLLFFWVTLITAPVSLFFSIRYWKAPSSIIPRTKIKFIFAFILSSLQIMGWTLFFMNIIPELI
ncbi:MAG: hypothetical protein OEV42_02595 [Deltaproteobacteria bacterium]|nr:hypothetical protein [Deltaproteobacteria bacterium]